MKTKRLAIITLMVVCIAASVFAYYPYLKKKQDFRKEQERLAEILSVSLDDYPYLPDDYFFKILKVGMSLDEVHSIVVGYKKVYHISDEEIYYYLSTDDNDAVRFSIWYDADYKIRKITPEDDNSRTLTTNGWDEGLLTMP